MIITTCVIYSDCHLNGQDPSFAQSVGYPEQEPGEQTAYPLGESPSTEPPMTTSLFYIISQFLVGLNYPNSVGERPGGARQTN